ncbi:cell division protein FtsL [Treponema sp.]|uniref:cell division protein FtsL n=1 Tax=Treponema sp. TaxID=166 RepID=UPI00298E900E|nr:cell division protein FtsL [Treponema sp.]
MKKKSKAVQVLITICYIVAAALIPGLLIVNAIVAGDTDKEKSQIKEMVTKQERLVDENKKLITDISLYSSAQRIGKIAEEELGMHKAEREEVVRVEMTQNK